MKEKVKNLKILEEILDSDDELPADYDDISHVPAYKDDRRFEYVEKMKKDRESLKKITKMCEKLDLNKPQICKKRATLLLKGHLNKKDTFCVQCFEHRSSKNTGLWLLNFLTFKDLQCNYKFLKSCLVPSYDSLAGNASLNCSYESDHGFEVINYT